MIHNELRLGFLYIQYNKVENSLEKLCISMKTSMEVILYVHNELRVGFLYIQYKVENSMEKLRGSIPRLLEGRGRSESARRCLAVLKNSSTEEDQKCSTYIQVQGKGIEQHHEGRDEYDLRQGKQPHAPTMLWSKPHGSEVHHDP